VLVEKYLARQRRRCPRTAVFGVEPIEPEKVAHQPFLRRRCLSKNKTVKFDYDETG